MPGTYRRVVGVSAAQARRVRSAAVDFRDTPDEAAFRSQLRSWLRANLPPDWAERPPQVGNYDDDYLREWSGQLYDAGYVGITWPEEYGGRGLGHTYQGIFLEESARAGAP